MNIRPRTLLSVGATLACLLVGVYTIASQTLLHNAEKLEADQTRHFVNQATDELGFQLQQMDTTLTDWSDWDDTYRFMADKNQAFITSNLPLQPSAFLDLDLMVFLDTQGKVFYARQFVRPNHAPPPQAGQLRAALGFAQSLGRRPEPRIHFSGVVALPGGDAVMVSVRPIMRTSGAGPPRGWIVSALRLDDIQTHRLAGRIHLVTDIFKFAGRDLPSDCVAAMDHLSDGRPSFVKPMDGHTIAGYALVRDVFATPKMVLRIRTPRAIYAEGVQSRKFLLGAIAAAGLVFGIVILWVLEIAALSRVSRLTRQVERIGVDDDEDHVCLEGRDELSWLATRIDDLIVRLRQGEAELRGKNDSLENINRQLAETNHTLANAVEGIAEVNDQGKVVNFNSSFAEMHGFLDGGLMDLHWHDLIAREDHDVIGDAITGMIESGKTRCEVRGRRRDGCNFYEEVVIVQAHDANGLVSASHWFTRDISERKELEAKIKHQAYHDPLTGLPNRALFVDSLRSACQRARRRSDALAVLFLDLDGFKSINDSMGHEAGDRLLAGVAERIQTCVRPQDTVARMGGDEFTVLLDRIATEEEAIEVAKRILRSLQTPISLPNGKAYAQASIGIAFSRNGDHDAEVLLNNADIAMYHSKDPSQPCFTLFSPDMKAPSDARKELADELRAAIESDRLTLAFQPIVDFNSGRPTGVEAFLRWVEPERGSIPPEMIIAVAEEAGLLAKVGHWCLRRACVAMKQLIEAVPEFEQLQMSVNMSAGQLQHPEINQDIKAALAASNLNAGNLRIEVSANSLGVAGDKSLERLWKISEIGVKFAIDDFGSGPHLISKLGDYPVDMVKIDGSIIWMLDSEGEARAIAQAMLIMARSAKVRVVAESIENAAQLNRLQELECFEGQGRFFSAPLSMQDLIDMLLSDSGGAVFAAEGIVKRAA